MNLLTENSIHLCSVGSGDGDGSASGEAAVLDVRIADVRIDDVRILDPRVEFMRDCYHCGEQRQFICGWVSDSLGLIGTCLHCGTPGIAEYTRENSGVA